MTQGPYHKRYKHGERVRPSQLTRMSTVDPLVDRECIMLDGDCKCFDISDCKYLKEAEDKIRRRDEIKS
jgi:hypothetical protein